jgi:hypothetical protein
VQDSMENVLSLEKIADAGGFWISGIKEQIGDQVRVGRIALHLGAKVVFTGKDGNEFKYEIKQKADTYRMINEMNLAIALERIDAGGD